MNWIGLVVTMGAALCSRGAPLLQWLWGAWCCRHLRGRPMFRGHAKKRALDEEAVWGRCKPAWVWPEVIRLASFLPKPSCRQVADLFNRVHGARETVGKSQAAKVLTAHAHEIADARRAMRRKPPHAYPAQSAWALDLSYYANTQGVVSIVLGIIDMGSRRLLCLKDLPRKCTLTLLGNVLLVMAEFGVPSSIKTDNESMFTSRLWKIIFRTLGVCRRRSRPGCPWENGRIERLFGTLKPLLKKMQPATPKALRHTLKEFKDFYNEVRVHQNLQGRTPMEVWEGKTLADVQSDHAAKPGHWISAMDGQWVGYRVRC